MADENVLGTIFAELRGSVDKLSGDIQTAQNIIVNGMKDAADKGTNAVKESNDKLVDGMKGGFDKVNDAIKTMGQGAGSIFDTLVGKMGVWGLAIDAVKNAFGMLWDTIKSLFSNWEAGARALTTGAAFEGLAKSAGVNAQSYLASLQQITDGTVSSLTLMQTAVKGMALDMTTSEIQDIAEAAKTSAIIAGGSVSDSIERMMTSTATGMFRGLRRTGDLMKEEIKELNKAMASGIDPEDLTKYTVELIKLNNEIRRLKMEQEATSQANLDALHNYEKMEVAVGAAGKAWDVFVAKLMENLRPALTGIVDIITGLINLLTKTLDLFAKFDKVLMGMRENVIDFVKRLNFNVSEEGGIGITIDPAKAKSNEPFAPPDNSDKIAEDEQKKADVLAEIHARSIKEKGLYNAFMKTMDDAWYKATEAGMDEYDKKVLEIQKSYYDTTEQLRQADIKNKTNYFNDEAQRLLKSYENWELYQAKIANAMKNLEAYAKYQDEANKGLGDSEKLLYDLRNKATEDLMSDNQKKLNAIQQEYLKEIETIEVRRQEAKSLEEIAVLNDALTAAIQRRTNATIKANNEISLANFEKDLQRAIESTTDIITKNQMALATRQITQYDFDKAQITAYTQQLDYLKQLQGAMADTSEKGITEWFKVQKAIDDTGKKLADFTGKLNDTYGGFASGMQKTIAGWGNFQSQITSAGASAISDFQKSLGTVFSDFMTGQSKTWQEYVTSFLGSISKTIGDILSKKLITKAIAGLSDLFPSLGKLLTTTAAPTPQSIATTANTTSLTANTASIDIAVASTDLLTASTNLLTPSTDALFTAVTANTSAVLANTSAIAAAKVSGGEGGLGGLLGGVGGGAGSSVGASASGDFGSFFMDDLAAGFFHSGGTIPYAHKGLLPDERVVIAQSGEGILSRAGMNNLGGSAVLDSLNKGGPAKQVEKGSGGGGDTYIQITAMDSKSFDDYLRKNSPSVLNVITQGLKDNKGLRQTIRNTK
jgi:hypothetical protein